MSKVVIAKEVPFPIFSLSIVAVAQILLGSFIILGKHLKISSIGLAITTSKFAEKRNTFAIPGSRKYMPINTLPIEKRFIDISTD